MYYSVCTDILYPGLPAQEALRRAAKAGYGAYEFWSWEDRDIDAIHRAQDETGMRLTAMCTSCASPVDPAQHDAFADGLIRSIETARKLGCLRLITQPGSDRPGVSREAQFGAMFRLFERCAPILEDAGVTLLLEPLNALVDHKGCFLSRSDEAFRVIRTVGSPRIRLLFDIYHQQITEGNLIRNLTENVELIGHIHAAGNPGRHELTGENEIDYRSVFGALKRAGYDGAVGLEYAPLTDADESLRILRERIPLD